jgi:hypothetical protein
MRKASGITKLLIQYLRKGLEVVARKRKCLLNKMKVVIFQLMMKMPILTPTKLALSAFTLPKYSGARYRESAPKLFMNVPFTVLKRMNQKNSNTWNFLK